MKAETATMQDGRVLVHLDARPGCYFTVEEARDLSHQLSRAAAMAQAMNRFQDYQDAEAKSARA